LSVAQSDRWCAPVADHLVPAAGNWVINTFLSETLIWQTELQQWLTQLIEDPTTSSAIGLLIQRVQFGSVFLGFLTGWGAKWFIEILMGKAFHAKARVRDGAAGAELTRVAR
jgi:hypothetical protein